MKKTSSDPFLRATHIAREYNLDRSSIKRWVEEGRFPQPIRLGPRTCVWRKSALDKFFADLEAAANNQE